MMDTNALRKAGLLWRVPERRDEAEILLDAIICGGTNDCIMSITAEDLNTDRMWLIVRLESGVQVTIPINY